MIVARKCDASTGTKVPIAVMNLPAPRALRPGFDARTIVGRAFAPAAPRRAITFHRSHLGQYWCRNGLPLGGNSGHGGPLHWLGLPGATG